MVLALILSGGLSTFLQAGNVEVKSIEITVSDLKKADSFYTEVLQFSKAQESRTAKSVAETLSLGEERLVLIAPMNPGRPIPPDMRGNDRLFQHLAIVVSDMDAACQVLKDHQVSLVSASPQTLPKWNYDADGIRALYFQDPDGHFLELIQFPPNKGEPKWQHKDGRLFLGIDHSAIVVRDMPASRRFYRDLLGMSIVGESFNYGGEQDRLSGVGGARVKITSLRGAKGPGIELLHYEQPGTEDSFPGDPVMGDLLHWQINLGADSGLTGISRDPDGHALSVTESLNHPLDLAADLGRRHWSRYLMEAAELGIFMIVALFLTIALEHPASPLRRRIRSDLLRRFIVGLGIGGTVVCLIYCQWGRQSGAQFNPSVTLAYLALGKIEPWDAAFYIIAQFTGGWLLLVMAGLPFRRAASHKKVAWVATVPGPKGNVAAFVAEFLISFLIFFSLLQTFHQPVLKPWIGVVAGMHLCAFITFESPFSGMSLNPARSVASALPARNWKGMWIYFTAPPLAMFLAARLCRWLIDS